jgi:hypothetical protein
MTIRHIVLAGLLASASAAQAGPTTGNAIPPASFSSSSTGFLGAWTLTAGSVDVRGMVASGQPANAWNMHTALRGPNDGGGMSAMLFTPAAHGSSTGIISNGGSSNIVTGNDGAPPPPKGDGGPLPTPGGTDQPGAPDLTGQGPMPQELPPVEAAAIPEPSTGALMLAGLAGAGLFSRRRRVR